MTNRIQIRRPSEAKRDDVIVVRPTGYETGPAEAGEWIVTNRTPVDDWLTRIDYITPDGRDGVLVLTTEQWIAVAVEPEPPLMTDDVRDTELEQLSDDDRGHITAYLADQFPEVFDAAIAAFSRYRHGLPEVA